VLAIEEVCDDCGLNLMRDAFSTRGQVLKIQRSSNGQVVFTLSGQIDEEQIAELEGLIKSEAKGRQIVLDLKDLTLVDRDAISFLMRCQADNIQLKNCPVYIREWITRERKQS
jgi:ABC-type transporter Mla MlaB component